MNIGIAGNYRTLLILLLLLNPEETAYIFQDGKNSEIVKRMKEQGYICYCYQRSGTNGIKDLLDYYKYNRELTMFIDSLTLDPQKDAVFGADHICAIFQHFIKFKSIYVVEEGYSNYTDKETLMKSYGIGSLKFYFKRILMMQFTLMHYIPYGYSNSVRNVYLTEMRNIPAELLEKTIKIKMRDYWNTQKSDSINQIFGFHPERFIGKTVLLTQPLSEDGILTEEEKISIYQEFIETYEGDIVIKPHPREKTDYSCAYKDFSYVDVAENSFPFELISLNAVQLRAIVTINSTAAYDFIEECKTVFLGTKVNKKLVDYFGYEEGRIMKLDD